MSILVDYISQEYIVRKQNIISCRLCSYLFSLHFCFPFVLIFDTLLMFCPPPSCVCCLIAEPPSPRPWDPPGSMYHLLHHLSPLSSFLLLLSPLINFPFSHICVRLHFRLTASRHKEYMPFVPRVVRNSHYAWNRTQCNPGHIKHHVSFFSDITSAWVY